VISFSSERENWNSNQTGTPLREYNRWDQAFDSTNWNSTTFTNRRCCSTSLCSYFTIEKKRNLLWNWFCSGLLAGVCVCVWRFLYHYVELWKFWCVLYWYYNPSLGKWKNNKLNQKIVLHKNFHLRTQTPKLFRDFHPGSKFIQIPTNVGFVSTLTNSFSIFKSNITYHSTFLRNIIISTGSWHFYLAVDVIHCKVDSFERNVSLTYVFAFNGAVVKDVTARYTSRYYFIPSFKVRVLCLHECNFPHKWNFLNSFHSPKTNKLKFITHRTKQHVVSNCYRFKDPFCFFKLWTEHFYCISNEFFLENWNFDFFFRWSETLKKRPPKSDEWLRSTLLQFNSSVHQNVPLQLSLHFVVNFLLLFFLCIQ
jgi:hypothetical protein